MRIDSLTLTDKLAQQGMLPLFYDDDEETCLRIVRALYDGGVRMIEFTNRGKHAVENFRSIVRLRNEAMPDLLLAVGTIRTVDDASSFMNEGADFLVSPIMDEEIADFVKRVGIAWVPGCMTPSEIHNASKHGLHLVKLFPGNLLTPAFVDAVAVLFPSTKYIVTGGVDATLQSIQSWLKTGVIAVGMGSKLLTPDLMKDPTAGGLKEKTEALLQLIDRITTK